MAGGTIHIIVSGKKNGVREEKKEKRKQECAFHFYLPPAAEKWLHTQIP
jgi:hypothetical protein